MFDPSALVAQYGYLAVAIGSMLEGETFLLIGGFAAHRGLLDLKLVVIVAFFFSFLGDQFYFFMGRRHAHRLVQRFPSIARSAPRVKELLDHWGVMLILGVRFMIGLRTAGPIVMGWAGVAPWKFVLFNLLGAAIWAGLIGSLGYLFGNALETLLQDLRRFEDLIIITIGGGGPLAYWLFRRRRSSKRSH